MRMPKNMSLVIVIASAILMMTGCQPSRSKSTVRAIEPPTQSAEPEPSQKELAETLSEKDRIQTEAKEVVDTGKGTPQIVLTKASHDFGDIGPSSSQKADYEFKNEGAGTLLVKNIQSTCGCSKPTLIKDGKRYPMPLKEPVAFESGQLGQVEVIYKAGATKGAVSKKLYIITNDLTTPRAQLVVKATTVVNVSVVPEKVELRFDKDNAEMPELTVTSLDGKEFSIKSVTVANKTISIPFDPKEKAIQFILESQVDIQKLKQNSTGVIQISTDHPQGGRLLVRYNAKPLYEVSNPRYILQNVEPGKSIIRENLIRSNYGNVAEIESVTSRNGYIEIESQQQDGNHIKLKVKITPPAQSASVRRYITDELNIILKDGHKLTIRCSGWFRLK